MEHYHLHDTVAAILLLIPFTAQATVLIDSGGDITIDTPIFEDVVVSATGNVSTYLSIISGGIITASEMNLDALTLNSPSHLSISGSAYIVAADGSIDGGYGVSTQSGQLSYLLMSGQSYIHGGYGTRNGGSAIRKIIDQTVY